MRLLLCFILSLSISLACDQPYEEVEGFKIGCTPPYSSIVPSDWEESKKNTLYGVDITGKLKDPLLSWAAIKVLDGNIEQVTFIRKSAGSRVMNNLLLDFKNKWGEYEKIKIDNPIRYVIKKPKSEIIDSITIDGHYSDGIGHIRVKYTSNKMKSYLSLRQSIKEKLIEDESTYFDETKKMAEQGYADAQFDLGILYYDGRIVTQDYKEAFKWFKKAADQDHLKSIYKVSKMYRNGQGVEKNLAEWIYWQDKCHEQVSHCW